MLQVISELLGHDHEQLSELLEQLEPALEGNDPRIAFELLDLFWARLAMHIRAENVHLFPAVLDAARSPNSTAPTIDEAEAAIENLKSDHNFFMDQLSQAVKIMREVISADAPSRPVAGQLEAIRDRLTAVNARLVPHNVLEEEKVYKWPALVLNPAQLESLSNALKRDLDKMPLRFARS